MAYQVIMAIAEAAAREGGVCHIEPCRYPDGTLRSFEDCVADGFLWYNTDDHSTKVIKIK